MATIIPYCIITADDDEGHDEAGCGHDSPGHPPLSLSLERKNVDIGTLSTGTAQ